MTLDFTPRVHCPLLVKSVLVTLTTVGFFFAGKPIALVALVAAGVLLLGRVRPEKVFARSTGRSWSCLPASSSS